MRCENRSNRIAKIVIRQAELVVEFKNYIKNLRQEAESYPENIRMQALKDEKI